MPGKSTRVTVIAALVTSLSLAGPVGAARPRHAVATPHRAVPMLPNRLLHCAVGRMTNLDPDREQRRNEIILEGHYRFDLMLPAIPVRQKPPPEETAPPEPVDPRTRISADRDGLFAGMPRGFDRVVDVWPDRVEMITNLKPPLVNMIVLSPIDPARGTADLFMTRATDAVTYDLAHAYQGGCTLTQPPVPAAKKGMTSASAPSGPRATG